MEVEITTKNFETYKNGDLPLVVDLWATWCGPCRMVAPIISELAQEYDGKLVVGKCDVEENDDIAMEFGVRNIPTVLFFKGGQLVDKFVGAASKDKFEEKFKGYTWRREWINKNDDDEIKRLGGLHVVKVTVKWGDDLRGHHEEERYVTFWRKQE